MAHYIADLIVKVESAIGEERRLAEKNCFDAILALWSHRAVLPNGKRPFEQLEPIILAIESLNPDDDTPRYFRSARPWAGDKRDESEAEAWLRMVDGLNYSAKVLIRYCLTEAARGAVDKSEEWVKLAEAVGADDGVPGLVIRFVSSAPDLDEKPVVDEVARGELEGRLRRLECFTQLSEGVASQWRQQLQSLSSPKRES